MPRLTIGCRLGLLVALLAAAVATVALIGALGVARIDRNTADFYDGTFSHARLTAKLESALQRTEIASLQYASIHDENRRGQVAAELHGKPVPEVNATVATAEAELGGPTGHAGAAAPLARMRHDWKRFRDRFGPQTLETTVGTRGDRIAGRSAGFSDGSHATPRRLPGTRPARRPRRRRARPRSRIRPARPSSSPG